MFEKFLDNKESWLSATGPDSDVVISSRMRLARNIDGYPFPLQATASQKKEILEMVAKLYPDIAELTSAQCINMDEIDSVDKQFLLERHLISQEHMHAQKGTGLIVTESEIVSIMVNEEDHLRMQAVVSGFDVTRAWELLNRIDDALSAHLGFSFMPDIGYLTACPTNTGTALRASCMLHLPALVLSKRINKILELLAKLSFTTRGLFGEGTQALGNFFQVSNQVSLGVSEGEIIENLSGVVKQVKEQELASREHLTKRYRHTLEDNVWRSLGILKNCRLITTKEALSHLSMLCIGLDLGIINGIERQLINNLFIIIQPAHLQKIEGKVLREKERDYIRAAILRQKLAG